MKPHYYILEGESLDALNRLIQFDTLKADLRMSDFRKQLAGILGKKGPEEDPDAIESKLAKEFSDAQLRGYKEKLGFTDPTVQVRSYGDDGALFRAYHVYPKLAMNPGTSKANFGLGDIFKDKGVNPEQRLAIYTAYEDYKGEHFAPPGARKITEDEFAAFDPLSSSFEYYRTYDEGIAMPADFDAAKHQTVAAGHKDLFNYSHVFLVTGEERTALLDYYKARDDWFMPYQDFRDKELPPLLRYLTLHEDKLRRLVPVDPETPEQKRAISFEMGIDDWDLVKDDLSGDFDLRTLVPMPMDGVKVILEPREDTRIGAQIVEALSKVALYPKNPVDFGFDERETLKNHAEFNAGITGFPYMKIERFEGGDVRLLVFRLPEGVKDIASLKDLTPISLDDYQAIAGAEKDLSAERPVTHAFRITGDAFDQIAEFDAAYGDYTTKSTALEQKILSLFQSAAPGTSFDEYRVREYKTVGDTPRDLHITLPQADYDKAKAVIEQYFEIKYASGGIGHRQDRVRLNLLPRLDTDKGREMSQAVESTPYEPNFGPLYTAFGFNTYSGYDQMKIERLDGMGEVAITYHLPAYIGKVEAPKGTVAMTREEYLTIRADSWDIRAGSPPPPRPDHLQHLPMPDGLAGTKRVNELKQGKDQDGLALHERTEFSWFKVKP